jgi:uncharacterized protein YndB with AHSA1/START domain
MSDYGVVTEPRTVRLERLLPGSMELVWEYLTDSEKRGTWLATGEMDLRAGGAMHLEWNNSQLSPHVEPVPEKYKELAGPVHMSGRIVDCDPPRLLTFTWGGANSDSEVTFELAPRGDDEVLLVITHRRLPNRGEMISVASGWHAHVAILLDQLRGDEPRPFWSTHATLEAEYEQRIQ